MTFLLAPPWRGLQGAHRRRDGGIDVGAGGGEHPAGKGGVVAAAVLGVEHQAQIQQPGLLVGVPVVVAHGVEEVLRHAQPLLGPVEVEGLVVVVVPLGREGVGHDHRYAGNELHRLPELVGQGHVIGPPVIGIEGQHRAGQLIHHIGAGGLEDHVLGEHGRQGRWAESSPSEGGELGPGGQGAEEKQVAVSSKPKRPSLTKPLISSSTSIPRYTSLPGAGIRSPSWT